MANIIKQVSRALGLTLLLSAAFPAAAEIQKFVYAYNASGEIILPKNAEAQCPDPDTSAIASTCYGVKANKKGAYKFKLDSKSLALRQNMLIVAKTYEFIAANSKPGITKDTYVEIETKRRLDEIEKNKKNYGVAVNKRSEASVKAIEKHHKVNLGKDKGKKKDKIPSVNCNKVNKALGNSKKDNRRREDDDDDDEHEEDDDDDRDYGLKRKHDDELNKNHEEEIAKLAEIIVKRIDDDNALRTIEKNIEQGIINPEVMDEVAERILTQLIEYDNNNGDPLLLLEADRYIAFVDEVINLNTGASLNADQFFGYTWLGVESDVSNASFVRSSPGSYLVCVTGEIAGGNDGSSDCVRIDVKDVSHAVMTPSDLRVPTSSNVHLSAYYSLGAQSYAWSGTGGSFTAPAAVDTTWSAPAVPGSYDITLTINDSETDTVTIEVYEVLPIAITTADREIAYLDENNAQVALTSSSYASNGTAIDSLLWEVIEQPQGSTATLSSTDGSESLFNTDTAGDYVVRLTATKGALSESVELDFEARLRGMPVADAGPDLITFKNQLLALDGNDSSDPADLPLTYEWSSTGGTVTGNTNSTSYFHSDALGTFTATLTVDNGTDSASDETLIEVRNRLPVASDNISGAELGDMISHLLYAFDSDGDALTYTLLSEPSSGGVTIDEDSGDYLYVPGGQKGCKFHPDHKPFRNDQGGNDVPVIKLCADKYVVEQGEEVQLTTSNSINATKLQGFTWIGVDSTETTAVFSSDEIGIHEVCVTGGIGNSNNTSTACVDIEVKEAVEEGDNDDEVDSGFDDSFQFKVTDGVGESNIATVVVRIGWVNSAPVADNQALSTDEDTSVSGTLTASDIDGQLLVYSVVSNGSLGTLVIDDAITGAFTYIPNADAHGTDTVTIVANDGRVDSATATLTIAVNPVNDTPIAYGADVTTLEDATYSHTLLASDADDDALTYNLVGAPAVGNVVITDASTGAFSYTPNANVRGHDSFTFMVNDGSVNSNVATINITIDDVNDRPIAHDLDRIETPEDTAVSGALLGEDIDSDVITFRINQNGLLGTLVINDENTGAFTYTPNPDANGTDRIDFIVSDGELDSVIGIVPITINPVNDDPISSDLEITVDEDSSVSDALSASDIDEDLLIYSVVDDGQIGSLNVTGNTTGAFTYTPAPNANGVDTVTFRVFDGTVNSNTSTVTITVNPVNDVPIANNMALSTDKLTVINSTLDATDVDGDDLTYRIISDGSLGSARMLNIATGKFSYTPNGDAIGEDTISFMVDDGQANSNTATVTIEVTELNNAPVANGHSIKAIEGTPYDGLLTGSDVEGSDLSFAVSQDGTQGPTVFPDPSNGNFIYTPRRGAESEDLFMFVVNDGQKDSAPAIVNATIVSCNGPEMDVDHDSDDDGYADFVELAFGTDINDSASTPAGMDPVAEGIDFTADTDLDGFADQVEVWLKSDPNDDTSVPTDSISKTLPSCIAGSRDQYAPMLMAFDILTPEITISTGNEIASFMLTSVDNMSGLRNINLLLRSPAGKEVRADAQVDPASNVVYLSFDSNAFGYYAEQGVWVVAELKLQDTTGNALALSTEDLISREFPYQIDVTNPNSDVLAPNLMAFDVLTPQVDLADANPLASFSATVNDSVAGVSRIHVTLANPNGKTFRWGELVDAAHPLSLSGQIDSNEFSSYSQLGIWNVAKVVVSDEAGNERTYTTADLIAAGYNTTVELINGLIDDAAPTLDNFIVTTPDVYPLNGDAKAGYKVTVSDDKSGIRGIQVDLLSPSGLITKAAKYSTSEAPLDLTTDLFSEVFDRYTECGTWTVTTVSVVDNSANESLYDTDALIAQGWDYTVTTRYPVCIAYPRPIAEPGQFTTDEDVAYTGTLVGSDPHGLDLTYHIASAPSFGSVKVQSSTGEFTYTPAANYYGNDSFGFYVDNGYRESYIALVSIIVDPVNDKPVIEDMEVVMTQNQVYVGSVIAYDIENDPLTFTVSTNGAFGSANFVDASINSMNYTPNTDFVGTDSVQVTVNDGELDSAPGTITFDVKSDMLLTSFEVLTPVVDADATNNFISAAVTLAKPINAMEEIRATLVGPSGQTLGFATVVNTSGSYPVTLSATTTEPMEVGTWTFINLQAKESGKFTVTVENDLRAAGFEPDVQAVINNPPVAEDAEYTTNVGIPVYSALVATDPDDCTCELTYRIVSNGSLGSAVITDVNTGAFTYTPTAVGTDTFTFVANDGHIDSNVATITVINEPSDGLPVAQDMAIATTKNMPYYGNLIANDPEAAPMTYSIVSAAGAGTVEIVDASTGEFVYTPNLNVVGVDSFTFKTNDGNNDSNTGTVSVTISEPNTPLANGESITVFRNVAYGGELDATDPNGDALTYHVVANPALGSIEVNVDTGAYTYTPNEDVIGNDSFTFYVTDGTHLSATMMVSINIIHEDQVCRFDDTHPGFDGDADGYADVLELAFGTNDGDASTTPAGMNAVDLGIDFTLDADGDHFADYIEVWLDTDPNDADSVPSASTLWGPPNCFDPNFDGIKPRLLGFRLDTPVVDISGGNATADFSVTVADNASGVRRVRVDMTSPSGAFITASHSYVDDHPLLDGVTLSTNVFSQFAEEGMWDINTITIYDEAGNKRSINSDEMAELGFPVQVELRNLNGDSTAPSLDGFTVLTPLVDDLTGNAIFSFEVDASDDIAGVASIQVSVTSPSGVEIEAVSTHPDAPLTVTGTVDSATLNPYLEDGTWTVSSLLITDVAGNGAQYADSLVGMGYSNTLSVSNTSGDNVAPTLDSFGVLTTEVFPASGTEVMSFAVAATDDVSGIEKVRIDLEGPAGQYLAAWGFYFTTMPLHVNAQIDSATLSDLLQQGVWTVTGVEIFDLAGNSRVISKEELLSNAFPMEVEVRY